MRMLRLVSLLLGAAPIAAAAAPPLGPDGRIETLEWRDGAELPLRTTTGGNLAVIFAPGEAVRSVLVGDPNAIEVEVAPQADSLTIRTRYQPANPMLEVESQQRHYHLRLVLGPANEVAYAVRFAIAAPGGEAVPAPDMPTKGTSYQVKGAASLKPLQIVDDGARTYLKWGDDQALPAIFALNELGEEETIDCYMRGGIMVIDRVYSRLVFRIGKHAAWANRSVLRTGG